MISSNKSDFTINFGLKPVSNRFLSNTNEKAPRFPLGISINGDNGLISIVPLLNVCVVGQDSI